MGKWLVIFKCACFLRRSLHRNCLAHLVTVGGVLSEFISQSKNHVQTYFKVNSKSQEKCSFHNMCLLNAIGNERKKAEEMSQSG